MIVHNILKNLCIATVFAAFLVPLASFADPIPTCPEGKYCSLTTVPGIFEKNVPSDPIKVVKNIYGISIGIAAALAVFIIIWAGVEYATTEAITGKSEAKEKWHGALWGLLLLLGSYLILRTINIQLVTPDLGLGTPVTGRAVNTSEGVLQNYLDAQTNLTETQSNINRLSTERDAVTRRMDAFLTDGGDPGSAEFDALADQRDALRTQITTLEGQRNEQAAIVQSTQNQAQELTSSATCFSVTSRGGRRESCFKTAAECQTAQTAVVANGSNGATKTACQTMSSAAAAEKYQYCYVYTSVTGLSGRNRQISTGQSAPQCSATPQTCQAQRTAKLNSNMGKKLDDIGFITSIGSCQAQLKSS